MREILFRGKKAYNSKWIEGYFYSGQNNDSYIIIHSKGYPSAKFIRVLPETVGQYTGLCDKNEKKIFEGDIIKISNGEIYTVVFEAGAFTTGIFSSGLFLGEWEMAHVEVIGNIYDDPELMKTK